MPKNPVDQPSKSYRFNILIRPEPEGGFTVFVPSLPGCITYGETIHEARLMAQEAIEAILESMAKHNEEMPQGDEDMLISSVQFNLYNA